MNFRTTYILLGIVIVALAALGIYVATTGDKKTNPSVEGFLMRQLRSADVKPDAINYVEIERPGQTPEKVAFAREEKRWVMVVPGRARCDGATVDSIVSAILNARSEKAADLSSSLAAHGLDNPPVKVTLKKSQGDAESPWIAFGNVTIGGANAVVYVTTSDEPSKPQAAKRNDFVALFKTDVKGATTAGQLVKGISDFRPMKVIGDGANGPLDQVVRSMQVRTGKDEIALFREPGGNWRFRIPADYGEAASDAAEPFGAPKDLAGGINSVSQLINTISNIQPANRDAIKEAGGDFAKYGLATNQNPLQIDFVRDDGVKETMYVGGPIKKAAPKKEGEKSEVEYDAYFARNEADSVVYEVPGEPVKKVLAVLSNKGALRDRTVLRLNPQRIDAIDIDANGDKFELRRVGFGWQVYDAEGKARPANAKAVEELIRRLTERQLATSFPPPGVPDDKMGFTKPSAEIKFWEGGIVPDKIEPGKKVEPAPKPKVIAPPTARLVFGIPDVGDVVHARRFVGEAKADYFLPVDVFKLASRGRLDYIEPSLKPLDINTVRKLTITHGKEAIEVERTNDDDKPAAQSTWKINGPERLKGRPADPGNIAHLLNQLAFIQPQRVVSDKVTPDVLNRLKVNPDDPRMKATLALKGQSDRVYLFGDDVVEKKAVYLKPGEQDLVFEIDRFAFDQLQKADVQDMVVHRIDKLKLKAVKIADWQEVLGSPATLEIERKEGKWTLKSGGMFELDPNKVDVFLNDLVAPKADAFVVYKTGPTPEHNLDPKNAMVVELIMEAGDPVKIVISPPNKEGKVFATSSLSPGDVFTISDKFATIRAKPAALKKD